MNLRSIATVAVTVSLLSPASPLTVESAQAQAAQQGFHVELPRSHNPLTIYTPVNLPPPNLANSLRLEQLIHDGKLYLSLNDAIDLALENNLDLAISRYYLPIANADVLRTSAGGQSFGVPTGVVQNTLGGSSAPSASGSSGGVGGAGGGTGTPI